MNDSGTEFHDRHETGEIHDFCDWIATVEGRVSRLGIFLSRNGFFGGFECCRFYEVWNPITLGNRVIGRC